MDGALLRHRLLENKELVTCSNGIVKCVGPSKLQGRGCAFLAASGWLVSNCADPP